MAGKSLFELPLREPLQGQGEYGPFDVEPELYVWEENGVLSLCLAGDEYTEYGGDHAACVVTPEQLRAIGEALIKVAKDASS